MSPKNINRREFLQTGLMATALATAGKLPLLSAGTPDSSYIDASTGPYALKPIRDHLSRFSPVGTSLDRERYTLTYDIVHWHWAKGKRDTFANTTLGQMVMKRATEDEQVMYNVNQRTTVGGVNNFIEAQITCNGDDLNSLRHWRLRSYEQGLKGESDPISELTETGTCRDRLIRINNRHWKYGFDAENPVVSQWTILDYLVRNANPQLRATFDLLQDLSLFKPNQQIFYDGQTTITCPEGQRVTLHTYAQIGQGVLPLHYLLDDQGRPQLVTTSIVSWALSEQTGTA